MPATDDPLAAPPPFAASERLPSGRVLVRDLSVGRDAALAAAPALEAAFARHDGLAAAVARRLRADGVAAHGAFVVHPKGLVRNGRGAPRDAERFDAEVDAVDLGVALVDGDAFAAARGEAILDPRTGYGALAMLALTLELRRRRAGRVVAVASASVEEAGGAEAAFEANGLASEVARSHFRAHFGFEADACDLDAVAAAASLGGLRWNAPVWGAPAPFEKYDDRGAYHWNLYSTHDAYRRRADTLVSFLASNLPRSTQPVLDVGAGDGLFAGLLARQGIGAVALDPEPRAVLCAREAIAGADLAPLVACVEGTAESMPFPGASFRAAMLLDVVEHLRNPVRALAEIRRVLSPEGALLVATPAWRYGHRNDPVYHLDEYREDELARQLRACGFEVASTARIKGAYDDIVMLARRRAG
jgi:SAM-dependent methyltransferase